ncbi:hypothetical protein [Chengkuizengella axinellae]|uniref:Uncharacterized protein n=1 Tax=Chengkuizengella axinellae TaxID=3064388 RepID=A0ABT9IXF1_9BACL|nr:hypothetical protein [Chengkuizengella sp. 2205SS18-9]MDP5274041.1 hypothetical protein [Chengkuizengella sp. 2205SS18-9]
MNKTWWFKQKRMMVIILLSGLAIHLVLALTWIVPKIIQSSYLTKQIKFTEEQFIKRKHETNLIINQKQMDFVDEDKFEIANQEDSLDFTINLNLIANKNNVDIHYIKYSPSQWIDYEQYELLGQTVSLFITGGLQDITDFMNDLERLEKVIQLMEWETKRSDQGSEQEDQGNEDELIQLHLKLFIHYFD